MSRITQADLARRLGLSTMAVSLALRDHPRVSAETRAKVRALAEELGYRPDTVMSDLGTRRWKRADPAYHGTVAFLLRERALADVLGSHEWMIARALRARLAALGYGLEVYGQDKYTPRALGRVLRQRGVEAIVYTRLEEGNWREGFPWDRFVSVAMNYSYFQAMHHAVILERFQNILDLWALLCARGFKRIGVIGYAEQGAADHAIANAAMLYASRLHHGRDPIPACRLPTADTGPTRQGSLIHDWLLDHKPDVILAWSDPLFESAKRVSPAGKPFHGCVFCLPPTATDRAGYVEDYTSLANAAADLLHGQLRLGHIGMGAQAIRAVVPRVWRDGPEVRGIAP